MHRVHAALENAWGFRTPPRAAGTTLTRNRLNPRQVPRL